jgi:hypothetical protein
MLNKHKLEEKPQESWIDLLKTVVLQPSVFICDAPKLTYLLHGAEYYLKS